MSKQCPQYRVHYQLDGSVHDQVSANGPYDYRYNAIAERNARFAENGRVTRCWITKEYETTGKVLAR